MLDIIVTHYNEPWSTGRKFFDMLGCQRGINFNDIRVLLIHDGSKMFPDAYFGRYPYRVVQYRIAHGGVSKARNYGLEQASEKWVEFCDFDDMYINAYALKGILEVMGQDVDYMWTPFLIEFMKDGKLYVKPQEENAVFVHGKYFRREWLLDNGIWFPEGIHYSEDSAFCAIVNELAQPNRRGKIKTPFPAYSWVVRADSVSMDPKNRERNLTGFIERNFYVVEEFKRRGIPHQLMVGRMFADAYHAFHQKDRSFPEYERAFADRAKEYLNDLYSNNGEDMKKVLAAAGKTFPYKETEYNEPFMEWVRRITGERLAAV